MYDYRIIDVGSTYTKQRLINRGRVVASAQAPTSLADVNEGIAVGGEALRAQLGGEAAAAATLASSSAAGGLRMVAIGFMARVTAKAAKEVAMNSGARILEIISYEDPPDYRVQILREIRPDIVLLAGGTDYGDESALLENARILVQSGVGALVVLAGNIAAQPAAAAILREGGVPFVQIANIMPDIHSLVVDEARRTIHREFIRQITKAPGLRRLQEALSHTEVVPTPGAVLLAAELLARGSAQSEGLGSLIVVDLGGATTDVHSVIPAYEELPPEELGLIVTNLRQVAHRSVEGNLGLRGSACGVLAALPAPELLAREGLRDEGMAERLQAYCEGLAEAPERLPQNEEEALFDRLLAQAAVEVALKRHAGYYVTDPDPVTGLVPGMPIGRDLRDVHTVIAVGGFFAHRPAAEGEDVVRRALGRRGISLLPEAFEVYIDSEYLLYAGGVIGMQDEAYALGFLKRYFKVPI